MVHLRRYWCNTAPLMFIENAVDVAQAEEWLKILRCPIFTLTDTTSTLHNYAAHMISLALSTSRADGMGKSACQVSLE
jgi:hypothetical protein